MVHKCLAIKDIHLFVSSVQIRKTCFVVLDLVTEGVKFGKPTMIVSIETLLVATIAHFQIEKVECLVFLRFVNVQRTSMADSYLKM